MFLSISECVVKFFLVGNTEDEHDDDYDDYLILFLLDGVDSLFTISDVLLEEKPYRSGVIRFLFLLPIRLLLLS